jgi:hypothetical protein
VVTNAGSNYSVLKFGVDFCVTISGETVCGKREKWFGVWGQVTPVDCGETGLC